MELKKQSKLVFIACPVRAFEEKTVRDHLAEAAKYVDIVLFFNHIPIIPQLWVIPSLNDDDPRQRELGMAMGRAALNRCDELWCFGDRVSDGMRSEIRYAMDCNKPVKKVLFRQNAWVVRPIEDWEDC